MDTNFVLRDGSSNLTQDETLATKQVIAGREFWLHVVVPEVSASDTLDVEIEFCAASASTTQVYNMFMKQITAAGHYAIPFICSGAADYVQVKLDLTESGGGSLAFGATKVWIDVSNRGVGPIAS